MRLLMNNLAPLLIFLVLLGISFYISSIFYGRKRKKSLALIAQKEKEGKPFNEQDKQYLLSQQSITGAIFAGLSTLFFFCIIYNLARMLS